MIMLNSSKVKTVTPVGVKNVVDITVHRNHTFVTSKGMVVHNCNSTQPALRNFMEEYSRNCGFILTCNYGSRIIAPLHSRCAEIVFNIPSEEATSLARQFLKRAQAILTASQVTFDKAVLVQVIQKFFPDWRRVLNELQRYSATGSIDSGILTDFEEADLEKLLEFMRGKDYTSVRNWVANLGNNDHTAVYRKIYDTCSEYFSKNTIPAAVLILAKYQYQSAFAADQEINLSACIAELLIECEWV